MLLQLLGMGAREVFLLHPYSNAFAIANVLKNMDKCSIKLIKSGFFL